MNLQRTAVLITGLIAAVILGVSEVLDGDAVAAIVSGVIGVALPSPLSSRP